MSNEETALMIQSGKKEMYEGLWKDTKRLLFKMVNAFGRTHEELLTRYGLTIDDLQQVAFLALVRAVDSYNPAKEIKLTSYFPYALKTEIRAAMGGGERKTKDDALNYCAALDAPVNEDSDTTLGELLPDPFNMEEEAADAIECKTLWDAVNHLPEQRCIIIKEIYQGNSPLTTVSAAHGLTYRQGLKEHEKALQQLYDDKALRRIFADRINLYAGTGLAQYRYSGASCVEKTYERWERIKEQLTHRKE